MNDDVELVHLVKDFPNLYDPSHPKYFDNASKDRTWVEIGNILQKDADECRNKWKSLRECYRKALRKRESKKMRPWRLESQMDFIRPFVAIQKDDESAADLRDESFTDEEVNPDEPSQPHQDVVAVYAPETSVESLKSEIARKNALKRPAAADLSNGNIAGADYSEGFMEYLQFKRFKQEQANFPMAATAASQNNEHHRRYPPLYFSDQSDNLSKYFQVIEETVRTLTPKHQIKVKAEISKIVYAAEYQCLESKSKNVNSPKKQPSSPLYEPKSPTYKKNSPERNIYCTSSDEDY